MTKTKYAVDAATRRIRFKRKLKLNLWCWMFMSLAVGFYILFQGYPIICSIQYSLLDWSGMTSNATFIGLQNYKELMHDELFWNAFINSFKYMVMIVPLELAVSLFLAYLLNDEKMKGRGLYRTMYFVPVVTTASVVGIIMIFILGVQGPVNHLLVTLHILKTMTEGGPYYATDVIATYVYRTAFSSEIGMPRLGYASAAALFFGGAVIIIGILLNAMKDRLQKNVQ